LPQALLVKAFRDGLVAQFPTNGDARYFVRNINYF
jgi:hypothetical protein